MSDAKWKGGKALKTEKSDNERLADMLDKFTRDTYDERADRYGDVIAENWKHITEANRDILFRLYERKVLIENSIAATASLPHADWLVDGSNDGVDELIRTFENEGFENGKVREAVHKVRVLFFDDTDEDVRKCNCVAITSRSGCGYEDSTLCFHFRTADDRMFSLDIPRSTEYAERTAFISGFVGHTVTITAVDDNCTFKIGTDYNRKHIAECIRTFVKMDGNSTEYKSNLNKLYDMFDKYFDGTFRSSIDRMLMSDEAREANGYGRGLW